MFCSSSGACSWISTLFKMFTVLSRCCCFALQQNFSSVLAFSLACPRCFILLLVHFLICFSDHPGGGWGDIYTQVGILCILQIIPQTQCGATRKTTVVFSSVQIHSVFILYILLLPHEHGHKYNFATTMENPLQLRV